MDMNTACEALSSGCCLEIKYHGFTRVVEVHTCGITTANNPGMRVWQVRGGSVSQEPVGWKLLLLKEAISVSLTSQPSAAPRVGYKRGDKAFRRIIKQL